MKTLGFVLLSVAAFATSARAKVVFPETPAAQEARRYVETFNSGDPKEIGAFLRDDYPGSSRTVERTMAVRLGRGAQQLVAVRETSADRFVGRIRYSAFDTLVDMTVTVDPANPKRVTDLSFREVTDQEAAIARLDDMALAVELKRRLVALPYFSGVVLVARDGEITFQAAQGLADRTAGLPNRMDTRFRVASMGKMFTAVAVMQLKEAGKLRLDAPFEAYLKDYPNQALARSVTIRQLLDHTGGTGDIFGPEFDKHRLELKSLSDYVALYGARPGEFPPGSKWDYSNYGYVLLGRVVEVLSGQAYDAYLRDHIFAPAGMTRSGLDPEVAAVTDLARPYGLDAGGFHDVSDTLPWAGTSAGGGYSTATDMLRFARALEAGQLVNREDLKAVTTGHVEAEGGGYYGYGFIESKVNGARVVGHSGGSDGMNGDLAILGDGEGVVISLSNLGPPFLAQEFAPFISARFKPR